MSIDLYDNLANKDLSRTTVQEEPCSCCPYGFHIHTDFVKFAEEQLNIHDMSIKTIHAPKDKLWCSKRTSVNSMVMTGKSPRGDECSENTRNAKVRPVRRTSLLIQQRIFNLQTCTPKSDEEIYGRELLDAIQEFENFVTTTWGKKRSCTISNIRSPIKQTNQHNQSIHHVKQIKTEERGPRSEHGDADMLNQSTDVHTPSSRTQGMNTESLVRITTTGTNTLAMESTPTVRTGPLSKLTIRTRKPTTQQPDCGGDVGLEVKNETKCEEPEITSSTEDFEDPSSEEPKKSDHVPKHPIENMTVALKVLNEALLRGRTGQDVGGALSITQTEWFETVGQKDSHANDVATYLTTLESYSPQLLRYMVNIPDTNGITALHYAVSYANFQVVSKLLDTNVTDPNKPNKAGYTSIMLASLSEIKTAEQEKVVRKLISLGDVNIKAAQHGQTALMLAASHGRFKMVKLLLQGGSDVNAQDEDGSSALMCAVEHGHADIVQCLLAQPGCDPNLTDNDGLTALNVAMEAGHKDIAVLLYAHMHFVKPFTAPPQNLEE